MNIINMLKDFFSSLRKEKPKLLMQNNNNKVNNEMAKYVLKVVNEPTLEECIEEFIKQYSMQEKYEPKRLHKSYKAFIGMFCKEEEEGKNFKNQIKLGEFVRKKGYQTATQYSKNRIVFMHIIGEIGIDEKKDHEVEKLHINCARKDIACLTKAIFNEIHDIAGDKFQMKCISEQFLDEDIETEKRKPIKNYQRNDKIVIYAVNHAMAESMAQRINALRVRNPELFSTIRTVPLLQKKCGFIGIGKEKLHQHAETPLGHASGRTYNDYLSDILFQSIVAGFDDNISGTSSGHEINPEERMSLYTSIYNEMIPEQRNAIITKSKEIFLQICRENNVNTIYTPTSGIESQSEKCAYKNIEEGRI